MKHSVLIIILVFITLPLLSQKPSFEWASQCGNPPNTTDTKTVLASGPVGQFYLAGEFLDTTQFGDKMLISSGGTDIFLTKFTVEGEPVWADRIGAADYDYVQNVITDENGNVIIAGYFYGSTQIGADHYTSYGSQDIFIAKFNPEGTFLWSFRAGGITADYVTGLAMDSDQNLVISGYFYDAISFGDTTLVALSSSDIYLAKFNTGGELIWATMAGGSSSDQCRSVSIAANGNILLTGSFYYDITLGDTTLTTENPVGVVIAGYLPDGRLDRAFQLDGTYLSPETYVGCGQGGDFYISGNFSEQVTFGATTFEAGEFNQDIFVAKYNDFGDLQWAKHAYSDASDQVVGISTDPEDNLYLTGHFLDTICFDGLTLPYTLCCGSREVFIVKYSSEGNLLCSQQISGARANVQSMALNSNGDLLLSGLFTEEVILGDLILSNFEGFQNYVTCLQSGDFTFIDQLLGIPAKVYPNPARDRIQIVNAGITTAANYIIYSSSGIRVISGNVHSGENIDIGFLPAGIYMVRLVDRDRQSSHTCLFIKQ